MRSQPIVEGLGPLVLLLVGVFATASLIPYMGVFIVQGLGKSPLYISGYASTVIVLTLLMNRWFGARLDAGARIAPMLLAACLGYVVAVAGVLFLPSYATLLLITAPGMAVANTSIATMYSYGRQTAERSGWDVIRYNARLRATTSLGWMIAPALTFAVAGAFGATMVFVLSLVFGAGWLLGWALLMPGDVRGTLGTPKPIGLPRGLDDIWPPVLVCLLFSVAHAAGSGAIALYTLEELGLPVSTPGLMLSAKTAAEIIVILASPRLILRFGTPLLLMGAAAAAVATYFLMALAETRGQMIALGFLEGAYYGTFAVAGLSYVQSFAAGRMGRATALYMNALFLGGLLGSPIMALFASLQSFAMALVAAGALSMLSLVTLLVLEAHRRRHLLRGVS
ncbi:MFS transporter [Arenibacterium sp. LLYu02]|uniref:MFS transporter n=1 Tax=Arenibacterium sp. LLYu02 TaxID=3404132 RepID=UPI003B21A607